MKSYHEIIGDGGSNILGQVLSRRTRSRERCQVQAPRRGRLGEGRRREEHGDARSCGRAGGARAQGRDPRRRLQRPDAGAHGRDSAAPCRSRAATGRAPRSRDGVGVFSVGALLPESEALDFASVSQGESHTWRATREFAALGELLGSVAGGRSTCCWSTCRPGPSARCSSPSSSGPRPRSCWSRSRPRSRAGVVARSRRRAAPTPNRVLGYVENMSGYACAGCGRSGRCSPRPRTAIVLGPRLPGPRALRSRARVACDRGVAFIDLAETAATRALARRSPAGCMESLEEAR